MNKITKARTALVLDHPFWGALALRLRIREDPTCKTCWTDGIELGYNPEFIGGLRMDTIKGLLAHAIMHVANQHNTRRGFRKPQKWNVACDHAINPLLIDAGLELPETALLNDAFKGKAAETIYSLLPAGDHPNDTSGSGNDKNDSESQNPKSGGKDPGGCGEVRDFPGTGDDTPSEVEKALHEQAWKVALTQAAQVAKRAGKLPSGMERFIKEIVQPKVDWRDVLRDFLEKSTKNDYSWLHPSSRYLSQGIYLPGLHSSGDLERIAIAVDTSGSITSDDLNQITAEIFSILDEFPETTVDLLFCDCEFQGHQEITFDDLPLKLDAKGGGGTSFHPVFEWLEKMEHTPTCLIYLTDLCCDEYPPEPDFPVLWVKTEDSIFATKPPFGREVSMEPMKGNQRKWK